MTDSQEKQILKIARDLDTYGYGELLLRWRDNRIVKISATKDFKPIDNCPRLTILVKSDIIEQE